MTAIVAGQQGRSGSWRSIGGDAVAALCCCTLSAARHRVKDAPPRRISSRTARHVLVGLVPEMHKPRIPVGDTKQVDS